MFSSKFLPSLSPEEQQAVQTLVEAHSYPIWLLHIENDTPTEAIADNLWPLDKGGMRMRCLGRLNLTAAEIIPGFNSAHLAVFLSQRARDFSAKDRCFAVICIPADRLSPSMVSELGGKAVRIVKDAIVDASVLANLPEIVGSELRASNEAKLQGSYLLFDQHPRLEEAKLISAFAANGITYSAARAQDSCYEHLVEEAKNWRLLWRLPSDKADCLLMIRVEDFAAGCTDKCFLVRFWA